MKTERPKILCLGVSYANIEAQLRERGYSLSNLVESSEKAISTDAAIECVQHGILTQMDGRDLARCLATEERCNVDVYCVSQEKGAIYRQDRHLDANFNRASFVRTLQNHFQGCQFDQIVLDYYWIPVGWDIVHWSKTFFEKTLIAFAGAQLLQNVASAPALFNGKYRRGIYLPFCFHCFKAIVSFGNKLKKHFNISFLRKNELDCLTLWAGTQSIDFHRMQTVLGKRIDQEEVYCTFGPRHIKEEMEDENVSKKELVELASSLEDFSDIRFIVLESLPSSQSDSSRHDSKTAGRFLGVVNPSEVKRGFRHICTTQSLAPIRSPPAKKKKLTSSRKRLSSTRCNNSLLTNVRYNLRQRLPGRAMMLRDYKILPLSPVQSPFINFKKTTPTRKRPVSSRPDDTDSISRNVKFNLCNRSPASVTVNMSSAEDQVAEPLNLKKATPTRKRQMASQTDDIGTLSEKFTYNLRNRSPVSVMLNVSPADVEMIIPFHPTTLFK